MFQPAQEQQAGGDTLRPWQAASLALPSSPPSNNGSGLSTRPKCPEMDHVINSLDDTVFPTNIGLVRCG